MKKAIILDVDGTLVDYDLKLSGSTLVAIDRARKAGHEVYLCTGRSKAETFAALYGLPVDGYIGGKGAYIEVREVPIYHHPLTEAECASALAWLHAHDLPYFLETNEGLFANQRFLDVSPVIAARFVGDTATQMAAGRKAFPALHPGDGRPRAGVNKISWVIQSPTQRAEAASALPTLQHGWWGGRDHAELCGEIGPAGISKASGVGVLLAYLGLQRSDAVGFGDSAGEIPMLQACGTAVAMGNASADVKAMADFVTRDVDADGLRLAFDHLGLLDPGI